MNASLSGSTDLAGAALPGWLSQYFEQDTRLVRIESALDSTALVVERVRWTEAVDALFEGEVDCVSLSTHLDIDTLIGTEVSLRRTTDEGERAWHGYVVRIEHRGADGGLARYRLTLAPWAAWLQLRLDSYVWQDRNARDIIEDVFREYPQANWRWDAKRELSQRTVCTQYRETDLEFVQRLLAEEGLNLRFEHPDEATDKTEHARHCLVVFDDDNELPDLGALRYAVHGATSVLGTQGADSIAQFSATRRMVPSAVTRSSWDAGVLVATAAQSTTSLKLGQIPALEDHDGGQARRYADPAAAQADAERRLAAYERQAKGHQGSGTVRRLTAGARFTLTDHPDYLPDASYAGQRAQGAATGRGGAGHVRSDAQFTLTRVEHRIANNLRTGLKDAATRDAFADLPAGGFDVHFECVAAAAHLVPMFSPKPTVPGPQIALIVGVADEAITTDRDLRVRIQYPWDRRPAAEASAGAASTGNNAVAAPNHGGAMLGQPSGAEAHGIWVRVSQELAGPNWGAAFTPRIGTEVMVDFEHADIDRPIIVGSLHNPADAQPWPAGADSAANHPGTILGVHVPTLDGSGYAQWLHDDATGQLRQRLSTSAWNSRLELGYQITHGPTDSQRGRWRGEGFEFATEGWGTIRAGEGLFISTAARPEAASTAMDAAEYVAQLKNARSLGKALSDMAQHQGGAALVTHQDGKSVDTLLDTVDPKRSGKYTGAVGGQDATKPTGAARSGGDPVEKFAKPVIAMHSASDAHLTTPSGIEAYAGEHLSLVAQQDLHVATGHTFAAVAGEAARWITHAGGINAIAAQGDLSVRAHTDALELLADQAITVTSSDGNIRIEAQDKITLQAAQAAITLQGGDITFACPGNFSVKGSSSAFVGPGSQSAELPALPTQRSTLDPYSLRFAFPGSDETADIFGLTGKPYRITDSEGKVLAQGTVPKSGRLPRIDVPKGQELSLHLGEDKWTAKPIEAHADVDAHAATDAVPEENDPYFASLRSEIDTAHLPSDLIKTLIENPQGEE